MSTKFWFDMVLSEEQSFAHHDKSAFKKGVAYMRENAIWFTTGSLLVGSKVGREVRRLAPSGSR